MQKEVRAALHHSNSMDDLAVKLAQILAYKPQHCKGLTALAPVQQGT